MHKTCKFIALTLALLLLTGCGEKPTTGQTEPTVSTQEAVVSTVIDTGDMFSGRDFETDYDESACEKILLNGNSVYIQKEGTYILSGTLEDGQIVINGDKTHKIQLILDGVNIRCSNSAAIFVQQADKVFITTAKGSQNILASDAFAESEYNIDAVIFSKEDLTLNGEGSLTIVSTAGHGVVSKDDLVVTGGNYTITSAGHGFAGKDSVRIAGGTFAVTAGKDGIHGENNDDTTLGFGYFSGGSFQISAEGDGISASNSLLVAGGDFIITAGGGSENGTKANSDNYGGFPGGGFGGGRPNGGRPGGDPPGSKGDTGTGTETDEASTSMKGIKANGDLTVQGGTFTINSADDGVHANANITVTGGVFQIATGDDGFHAEEKLTVEAGDIQITESYEGLEGHHILVSGGEISLVTSDDGLNAAGGTDSSGMGGRDQMFGGPGGPGGMGRGDGSIVISGGTLYIQASGDGIDANGTLEISGGHTTVCGPTQGDTATLDYDVSATISGGTFIGTGGSGMAQSFSDSQQGIIAVRVGNCKSGTQIILADANGKTVISYAPKLDFAVVILSSPEIIKGETYTITIGAQSATFEAT